MTQKIRIKKNIVNSNSKQVEWIFFGLFVALYVLLAFFHEPMYDEAQAWMIARDASLYDLLFKIPHYEGHPAVWHLILAVFAKAGIPFVLGLRIPGALFSILTAWLILFRSPFPKAVRCCLPFTYYIFFRYSVVVRPYCITMLALCLAAITYPKKQDKPFRFMAALLLLCVSSAYGMAMAAGICVVWICEIIGKKKESIKGQIIALAVMLIFNIVQLIFMLPMDDTNSVMTFSMKTFLYGLVYMLILGPADSMFLDVSMDARLQNYAEGIVNGGIQSYVNLFIGLLTILFLLYFAKKYKKTLLLVIPYVLFSMFSAGVYFWYHHIGLIHLYLIFVFWCALQDEEVKTQEWTCKIANKISEKNKKLCKLIPKLFVLLCLGMSMAWNLFCVGTDLFRTTWYSETLAEGIVEVGANQGNCALQWSISGIGPFETPEDYMDASKYSHTYSVTEFFDCLAFFDENIFYNHNGGNKEISYNQQIYADEETNAYIMEETASYGYPEFFVGLPFVLEALPIEEEMPAYVPVYRFEVYKPDKFIIDYNDRYIYAREDIYMEREEWPITEQLMIHN